MFVLILLVMLLDSREYPWYMWLMVLLGAFEVVV